MSLIKSEAKLTAVNELGSRLDDALENATKDLQKEEGAVTALKNATNALENLMKAVSEELSSKSVDLESQVYIKKYVERARSIVKTMAAAAENSRQAQAGKIAAFQQAVTIAKKYKDEEFKKLHMMKAAIERQIENPEDSSGGNSEPEGPRAVGTRPPSPIKMRRLVEEAVQESAVQQSSGRQESAHENVLAETQNSSVDNDQTSADNVAAVSESETLNEGSTKTKAKKQKK